MSENRLTFRRGTADQLKQKVIYLQAELKKYKQQVEAYQENYHYKQLDQLNEDNQQLQQEIDQSTKEYQQLQQEIDQLTKEYQQLQQKADRLQKRNELLESSFREMHEEKSEVEYHVQNFKEEIDSLREDNELKERTINEKDEQIIKIQEECDQLKEALKEEQTAPIEKREIRTTEESPQKEEEGSGQTDWFIRNLKRQQREDGNER
ncbi:hypothetical protein [Texcoconibacillus texcoconensis]|uniref:Chromosome segregation ATPase n=1 Tax=Texcoconibacillus texcoconensis TaxID=1095777 RepID=A0A840QU19_9BACI|nr:hypothetical protein [Texcoconibacillus texcoconensis]MBB5174864.1 chromosome segregation ATPase [Texcoconibacillus texcoconensis]